MVRSNAVSLIETVDSLKLANLLNRERGKMTRGTDRENKRLEVLVQFLPHTNTEDKKSGVKGEDAALDLAKHIVYYCPHLKFRGVMSMGALGNTKEFEQVDELRNKMLIQFADEIGEEDFITSLGTS